MIAWDVGALERDGGVSGSHFFARFTASSSPARDAGEIRQGDTINQ